MAEDKGSVFPTVFTPMKDQARLSAFFGVKLMRVESIWGPIWRYMDHNPRQMGGRVSWLPISFFQGTVFAQVENCANLIFMVSMSFVVVAISLELLGDQEGAGACDPMVPGSCSMEAMQYQANLMTLQQYTMIFMDGMNAIRTLVAFLLGGFVAMNVGKWQTKRGLYGKLVGRSRDAIMKSACLLQPAADPTTAALAHESRQKVGRYWNLAMELAICKTRGLMDDEAKTLPFLKSKGLIEEGEWEKLVPGDRHTTAYFWILCWFRHAKTAGLISEHEFVMMGETVSSCRGVANDMMDMLPNGFPFPYVQLVNLITKIFIFFLAVTKGLDMSVTACQWRESMGELPGAGWWFSNGVMLYGCHACFQGILDLQYLVHNPFDNSPNGVPHEAIVYGQIAKFTGWMVDGKCQPTLPAIGKAC